MPDEGASYDGAQLGVQESLALPIDEPIDELKAMITTWDKGTTEIAEGKLYAPGIFDKPEYKKLVDYYLEKQYTLRYTGDMVPDTALATMITTWDAALATRLDASDAALATRLDASDAALATRLDASDAALVGLTLQMANCMDRLAGVEERCVWQRASADQASDDDE